MALVLQDGFNRYGGDTADWGLLWTRSGSTTLSTTSPRTGTYSARCGAGASPGYAERSLPSSYSTVTLGCAFKASGITTSTEKFLCLYDGSTLHLYVEYTITTGAIKVYRGDGTLLGTASAVIVAGTWCYFELQATIHDSTGSVTLKMDEVTVLTVTGADTRNGGNASVNKVRLENPRGTVFHYFSDLYVTDTSGANNTGFLGAVAVEFILPSGAGNAAVWTPSTGANYAAVDEADPNGDTDYVSSSASADKDTHAMGNLVTTAGQVKAVAAVPLVRKETGSPATFNSVVRTGGADYNGADKSALTTSYAYYDNIWDINPGTSAAWTIAEVNALEAGYRNNS